MQRLLRISAAAMAAVAVAVLVMPPLLLWWADDSQNDPAAGPVLFTHYFVEVPWIAIVMVSVGIVALVLVTLARILDRLDDIQQRSKDDD